MVLVTNGSQIADLAIGSGTSAPKVQLTGRSWALWDRLARGRPEFGSPNVFFGEHNVPDAQWLSLTVTDEEARAAKDHLLRIVPHDNLRVVRAAFSMANPDRTKRYIEGLRKAGVPE